ncbi:hypothetical protein J6590_015184 [Homalodisca vitripennis]|nr:hypothetical protein J6590_015184 [Homalodisca vitripennis]
MKAENEIRCICKCHPGLLYGMGSGLSGFRMMVPGIQFFTCLEPPNLCQFLHDVIFCILCLFYFRPTPDPLARFELSVIFKYRTPLPPGGRCGNVKVRDIDGV